MSEPKLHMVRKNAEKLEVGDVVLEFRKNGDIRLYLCTQHYTVYDRQGGEGAIIVGEDGQYTQFSYSTMHDPMVCVIGNVGIVEQNPLRQLLVWRQQFER